MKRILLPILAVILLSAFGVKGPTFTLADNQVEVGAIYTLNQTFGKYSNELSAELSAELDEVSDFLLKHPKIKVEIGVHSDQANSEISTSERSREIMKYLSKKGVRRSSIESVGYGDQKPAVTQRELFQLKSLEEKMNAKKKNNRVEMKVVAVK